MITNNLVMPKLAQELLILAAVIAVAIADVFLKKATAHGNLLDALEAPGYSGQSVCICSRSDSSPSRLLLAGR